MKIKLFIPSIIIALLSLHCDAMGKNVMISGKVMSENGDAIDYASVFLKGTEYTCNTNEQGVYHRKLHCRVLFSWV